MNQRRLAIYNSSSSAPESSSCSAPCSSMCEACGETFACGAALGNCWCAGVELSETTRAELRARYSLCLCRACLERFADAERQDAGRRRETSGHE